VLTRLFDRSQELRAARRQPADGNDGDHRSAG